MRMPLAALAVVGSATAERLICASYGNDTSPGIVASLELSCNGASRKLEVVSQNKECGALPTWLDTTLSPTTVVCLDEAATNAALTTFNLESDGTLKKTSSVPSLGGAVAMATYNNNTALALAHFGPPAISTYKVHPPMPFQNLQNITFSAPDEIHQAVLDPTGQYMVFPSRSADLVHVYLVDPRTAQLTVRESLKAKKGYGPRHAVFWTGGSAGATYLFVVHEFSNRIVSYKVDYLAQNGGLNFTEVDDVSTYGNRTVPDKTFASEIVVSPCNSFVLAANRNGTVFTVDAKNGTKIPSDSIVTYKPTPEGKLSYVQLANSGGFFPRHFNLNKDGSMIAVANQKSQSVVIYERDVQTGLIRDDKVVASVDGLGPGDLMYVQWV